MTVETPGAFRAHLTGLGAMAIATVGVSAIGPAAAATDVPTETPASMVGALHSAFGQHHVRAVHAKGTILQGVFMPTAEAATLSRATVFALGTLPVTVRFSDFTGLPDIPDTVGDANPRGLAIKFRLPGGESLDLVTHSFNGFPTRTADEFAQLLRAIGESGAGASKPTALDRFLGSHPIAKTFLTTQKPAPVSYATLSYFGVNAFAFIDANGQSRNVRHRFVPAAGEQFLDAATLASRGPSYLQEELASRVAAAPIVFDWFVQLAQPGDRVDDPSIAWPEDRALIKLGTVRIERLDAQQTLTDKSLLFLPGQLPAGIEVVDPMVAIRNAAYPISFRERQ